MSPSCDADAGFLTNPTSLVMTRMFFRLPSRIDFSRGMASRDAIPLEKSILDGNRKNILVMTKEVGFVRKPASASQLGLIKLRYLKYPKVYELMADRHVRYNECLDYIDRQEKNGQAFVIRPHKKSDVGRIEKDKDKLIALYEEGYQEAENCYEDLLAYLEK